MTKEIIGEIAKAGTPLAEYLRASYFEGMMGYTYMWDELAAAAIIDPEIITETVSLRLDVDYLPGPSYGKTVWTSDRIEPWFAPETWTVQTDIDVERFEKLFIDLMSRPPVE
jgi:inosine-uridine nucleoside N-ribohydrolase